MKEVTSRTVETRPLDPTAVPAEILPRLNPARESLFEWVKANMQGTTQFNNSHIGTVVKINGEPINGVQSVTIQLGFPDDR